MKKIEKIFKNKQQRKLTIENNRKNSTLYFQIGLIICLLATYAMLEMKFERKIMPPSAYTFASNELSEIPIRIYTVEKPKQKLVKKEPKVISNAPKKLITTNFVIDNNGDTTKDDYEKVFNPETQPTNNSGEINLDSLDVKPPTTPVYVDYIVLEEVPVFPGCENKKTNEAKRKCFEEKISKFITKKFNGNIASEYGLKAGKQRVDVMFKIDKTGLVKDIQARAPHPKLEEEAIRVLNRLPKMEPGKQQNVPVTVQYGIPILFQVN